MDSERKLDIIIDRKWSILSISDTFVAIWALSKVWRPKNIAHPLLLRHALAHCGTPRHARAATFIKSSQQGHAWRRSRPFPFRAKQSIVTFGRVRNFGTRRLWDRKFGVVLTARQSRSEVLRVEWQLIAENLGLIYRWRNPKKFPGRFRGSHALPWTSPKSLPTLYERGSRESSLRVG